MSIDKSLMEKLEKLPVDKLQEVQNFVNSLEKKKAKKHPRRSLKGLWADLGVQVTAEDITEARREMWERFPREPV